jgi:SAM-dependent methyltransferase
MGHSSDLTSNNFRILVLSATILFLEVLLIRWLSSEINVLAYLQNSVLVACFLGLGVGCLTSKARYSLETTLVNLTIFAVTLSIPGVHEYLNGLSRLLTLFDDFIVWSQGTAKTRWGAVVGVLMGTIATGCLLGLIWSTFVPLGRCLGRLLDQTESPILAYSADLLGSLLGTWIFVSCSALYLPPTIWLLISVALLTYCVHCFGEWNTKSIACLLIIVLVPSSLSFFAQHEIEVWSPYQKLSLKAPHETEERQVTTVKVNNVGYQVMADLDPSSIKASGRTDLAKFAGLTRYDLPALLHGDAHSALVLGGGTGNDAAGALRNGVDQVTVVDIDPAIIQIGRELHPEQPYNSSKVRIVNDDARSFLMNTEERFDTVSFAMLDAHTATALTNGRLDLNVYTRESLQRVKEVVKPGGVATLVFLANYPFIVDRINSTLTEVFGDPPIITVIQDFSELGGGGVMFITGDMNRIAKSLESNKELANLIKLGELTKWRPTGKTPITTDDWPYFYLETPSIPILFYLLAGLMIVLYLISTRCTGGMSDIRAWSLMHWTFFFFGAAFILLEVGGISRASPLLGGTWIINAVMISGILLMALLANVTIYFYEGIPLNVSFLLLIMSCLILFFFDETILYNLEFYQRILATGIVFSIPVFFSGLVFIKVFSDADCRDELLGANMLGALVGGVLQYLSFLIGLKSLFLIVTLIYIASMFTHFLGDMKAEG